MHFLSYLFYRINRHFVKTGTECPWCQRLHHKTKWGNCCSKHCYKRWEREKNQVFKHNARCPKHKLNRLLYRGLCWLCWKEQWSPQLSNKKIPLPWMFKLWWHKFYRLPTYRVSKDSWAGSKLPFEQSLVDYKIRWFVYVKFYDESRGGKAIPIVIGKSGSLKVNASGSDLNFSLGIEDGPARKFLQENDLLWNYDFIYLRKCRSEKAAYREEAKFARKWSLYGS